jgi:hypothetical protein
MANISLYVSGQTELNDVTEFFQKRLIGEGETPIAFFDGVFYESHQERVGNIVFQDYLVYTDKAVYLWARGTSKDFLDRFSLGAVSVNSRNKDSAFATMNLKIKREGKEPVYVIFDMVEIREAEMIVKLHTVIESTVEDYLGVDFRQEIPHDIAYQILQNAQNVCPPRTISIVLEAPQMPVPDAGIGYGQDLLEQYKASVGYSHQQDPQQPGAQPRQRSASPMPEMPRGLEGILPTDPAAIKRIAGQLKDMVGDAPLKFRDQLMKDLQHVPNDVATVLTAVNELLTNIAGNPQAERFVMNAIKTAVENDGIIGSVGKIIKLTGIGAPKKPSRPASSPAREERSSRSQRSSARMEEPEEDSSIRRRKISVRDDDDHAGAFDPFRDEDDAPPSVRDNAPASASRRPVMDEDDSDSEPRRKKLSIRADSEEDNDIARKLMSYDEPGSEQDVVSAASPAAARQAMEEDDSDSAPRRKKLSIRTAGDEENDIARQLMSYDEDERDQAAPEPVHAPSMDTLDAEPAPRRKKLSIKTDNEEADDIARKLMSYDETAREERPPEIRLEPLATPDPEPEAPNLKKIQIKAHSAAEPFSIPEEEVLAAIGGSESGDSYMTLESDLPLQAPASPASKSVSSENPSPVTVRPGNGGKDDNAGRASDTHSVSVKPTP